MERSPIFDDGTYLVTEALIATPRRFYPIANTTARIRRDPLWAGMAFAALAALTLFTYGDLLFLREWVALVLAAATALLIGRQVSILAIDAAGHDSAMIVGRSAKITALYRAIRDARTKSARSDGYASVIEHESDE